MFETIIFLAAAVLMVPLCKKIGLGSVLGYLAAGVLIGPFGLNLIHEVDHTLHFAELGVVLLLFIIGLELQPSRLWALRHPIFVFGGLQVVLSTVLIAYIASLFGLSKSAAIVVGLALAMSSTAFALQLLAEKQQLTSKHGRSAFAILLFQDIAVIPILAIVPLLAGPGTGAEQGDIFKNSTMMLAALLIIVFGGRYLVRPFLRVMAATAAHEIMIAAGLLVVFGTAVLAQSVGLSMGLGAFLAGVLLADSEYRHELEANIEPFKGLLLGLFFIAVGMSVNLDVFFAKPMIVLLLVIGLMLLKALVLFFLGKIHKLNTSSSFSLSAIMLQSGEFGFVIFTEALSAGVLTQAVSDLLVVVVSLSMAFTPFVFMFNEYVLKPRLSNKDEPDYDQIDDENNPIVIVGFGRFGQIISRILAIKKITFTALEANFQQVDFVRKFGNKIYYGDATKLDLLRAAGAADAKLLVLTLKDIESSVFITKMAKKHFPHLKIYACSRNRQHTHQLMSVGVDYIIRETFLSSLHLSEKILQGMGVADIEAADVVEKFRLHDEKLLEEQFAFHSDKEKLIQSAKQSSEDLRRLFEQDNAD